LLDLANQCDYEANVTEASEYYPAASRVWRESAQTLRDAASALASPQEYDERTKILRDGTALPAATVPATASESEELEAIYAVCLRAGMTEQSTALDYISSVFCAFQRLTKKRDTWAVTVERNGESVVTVASNMLGGRDLIEGDADTIRTAARSLLGFVGDER
jgi:hypothetical protein